MLEYNQSMGENSARLKYTISETFCLGCYLIVSILKESFMKTFLANAFKEISCWNIRKFHKSLALPKQLADKE